MANKITWTPVEEMDLDSGEHTCYATQDRTGRYIWLTQIHDDTWDVEMQDTSTSESGCYVTITNCKTLTSAKRYAARYLL